MVKRIMNAVSLPAVVTSAVPTTEETLLQNWITPQFNIEQIIIYHIPYTIYYIMSDSSYTKWQISIFSAVIFILVINPYTYIFTQNLLGGILGQIANMNGCPTTRGLILHTIVYILLVRGSMDLKLFT